MEVNNLTNFSIDTIPSYLSETKQKLINMGIPLDRYEISKSLTISLNRILMGNKTELIDVYDSMTSDFENIEKKINLIEDKIKTFNSQQKFEYFIDPEKIIYIVFFKQIIYVKQLIIDITDYINSNINLVFIYCYLISKLYNEPYKISYNYIFIFKKIISDTTFNANYNELLKKIINQENIDIIFSFIKIIYEADLDFVKLLNEFENKKMEEYKKNNSTDYSDSYKEIEKEAKNINIVNGGSVDIYNIEESFLKKRDFMFVQKRKIDIEKIYSNIQTILQNNLTIELWFGFNLFIYKRFEFNFDEYQKNINKLLNNDEYKINLNYLNDIDAPDAGILSTNIIGGNIYYNQQKSSNINYYSKYIKYKNKYLKMKKLLN